MLLHINKNKIIIYILKIESVMWIKVSIDVVKPNEAS